MDTPCKVRHRPKLKPYIQPITEEKKKIKGSKNLTKFWGRDDNNKERNCISRHLEGQMAPHTSHL